MAIKKTQLYSSLWQGCDELRGGMDASQYKDYVLTLLFMKYVSDKYEKGGTISIPDGGSFGDIVKLKGQKDIGDGINKTISRLAEENDLKGVIDVADFNDEDKLGAGKDMIDRLSNLVSIFEGIILSANRADGDDLLGDAYEYLMRNFATESGKSKGQFYTPAEVSRILAKIVGISKDTRQDHTIYDPTCGSGSLLLKVADESPSGITIYGQEMDNATYALCRMNMFLHDYPTADIWKGNTLSNPYFTNDDKGLKTFDYAVANPPFSFKAWSSGVSTSNDPYNRFEYGVPPAKNGDYAFLLHILKSLKSSGKAAVILPHGVLFRGNVEGDIRRNIIKQGFIKGIIGLPANLFYGTGIPACIIVLDKEHHNTRKGIFMIDASKGFMKDGNKNRLRSQDIHKIVDVFNRQIEQERYSRMVTFTEIEKHEYNLNIPRYVDSSEPEDLHDLTAHLNGGIPNADLDALQEYWKVFPSLRDTLFHPNGREGYSDALVESTQIKPTILQHEEFHAFSGRIMKVYKKWKKAHSERLYGLDVGEKPKELIHELSEDLLERFTQAELLSRYDVYQILMDYWAEIMQDDVYGIVLEGWEAANIIRILKKNSKGKYDETADLVIKKTHFKADLISPSFIIARYFQKEQNIIDNLQSQLESVQQEIEQSVEERSGEEDILQDIQEGNKKVKITDVQERIDEYTEIALRAYLPGIMDEIDTASKLLATLEDELIEFQSNSVNKPYLTPLENNKGKIAKTNVTKRLKVLKKDNTEEGIETELAVLNSFLEKQNQVSEQSKELRSLHETKRQLFETLIDEKANEQEIKDVIDLRQFIGLLEQEKEIDVEIKDKTLKLHKKVIKHYPIMQEDDIKEIVIEDKWNVALCTAIEAEVESVTQKLANRLKVIEKRYACPLPSINKEVEALSSKVDEHLMKMGLSW